MNIGSVCNRAVVTAARDEPLLEAARRMRDEHVGALVVVEERDLRKMPIGMLTDRDIVVSVLARDYEDLPRLTVGDIMSFDLVTASEGDGVEEVVTRMRTSGVRRMPVVSGEGALVGIVAFDDVLSILVDELLQIASIPVREQGVEREVRS